MSAGTDRYDVKAQANWNRTRRDGSKYDRLTDHLSFLGEEHVANLFDVPVDNRAYLHGDKGYDLNIPRIGFVDVIHAGVVPGELTPRVAKTSHVIINQGSNKLTGSEYLIYVWGPEGGIKVYGWYPMRLFIEQARLKDFGYGEKWAVHATTFWRGPRARMYAYARSGK